MATLGKSNNRNFIPPGNTPTPEIITPKSGIIAEKTDVQRKGNTTDPSHD